MRRLPDHAPSVAEARRDDWFDREHSRIHDLTIRDLIAELTSDEERDLLAVIERVVERIYEED